MTTLPETQSAAIKDLKSNDSSVSIAVQSIPLPALPPLPGQILVKINYSGLCGSDKSLLYDEWSAFGITMKDSTHGIAGHEGAGSVVALATDVEAAGSWKVGDRAGIKWVASVCGQCEMCLLGPTSALHCPSQKNSGFTVPGTFQQYVLTSASYATHLPDSVPDEIAGPLMCGGVTAYVGCKRSGVRPGQWLAILGAGGGLGHLAVQYARAMGMRIVAVDGGDEKGKLCKEMGAEEYVDFERERADVPGEVKRITGLGVHGVLVTAGSKGGYEMAPYLCRPGGTVVAVGLPGDKSVVAGAPPFVMALRRLSVVGSLTGSAGDVEEALGFAGRGLVKPILTKGTLEDVERFCGLMKEGKLPGRAVLKIGA